MRCLDRIIGVHGEVERTSCACRACKEEDHAGTKAARHLGYAIVPDRIASDVGVPSEKLAMKPITSPDKGSMPAGPCRAGVAVIRNVAPSGLLIFVLCHGANPSAGVPSRCAPATWSIKCRISEQAETVRFDECSGAANQSDDWCTHDHSR